MVLKYFCFSKLYPQCCKAFPEIEVKIPQRYLLVLAKSIRVFLKRFPLKKRDKIPPVYPSLCEQSEIDSGILPPLSSPEFLVIP